MIVFNTNSIKLSLIDIEYLFRNPTIPLRGDVSLDPVTKSGALCQFR